MTTGERIRALRIERGLTQKELGTRCGMADSAIRRYESGRGNPTEKTIKRIAAALGVHAVSLAGSDAYQTGLRSGTVSASTIALELNVPVEKVWDAIINPGSVPADFSEKVAQVGAMLSMVLSAPEYKRALETIQNISYEIYKLNDKGQSVAVDRVKELTQIADYQLREVPPEVVDEVTEVD